MRCVNDKVTHSSVMRFPLTVCTTVRFALQALSAEEQRLKQVAEMMQLDERKRPYNSLKEVREPTEEEMEAFRMKRPRPDDPMASFLNQ